MKRPLKPYIFSMLLGSLLLASCGPVDDPAPLDQEQELITTLQLTLTPANGGDTVTAAFRDTDGDGGADPTTEPLFLALNTTYNASVTLLDESVSPPEDHTTEVKEEGDEHELFYVPAEGLHVTVQKTEDMDSNNRPIGLKTKFVTGTASSGTLSITLKHQPGLKSDVSDISKGETDMLATFPVTVR